jgi:hypothetical protein
VGETERTGRRRIFGRTSVKIVAAIGLTLGVVMGLNSGLVSCSTKEQAQRTRPLNEQELTRLADMRMRNYADGRVGLRGTIGEGTRLTRINGWVDWRRALIYLSVSGSTPESDALVQAVPGLIALRQGPVPAKHKGSASPSPAAGPGQPPPDPPQDGWRVRPIELRGDDKSPLDNLVSFLFLIAKEQPDRADLLGGLRNEWVRRDSHEGVAVDVLLGPAVLPEPEPTPEPSPTGPASPTDAAVAGPPASIAPSASAGSDPDSLAAHGGAVGYWLDETGRLQRLEALLAAGLPTTIDLIRADRTEFVAVDALGGRDIAPRQVSQAEAATLARMRQRHLRAGGGQITVTVPVLPGSLRTGRGWLDWRQQRAYVSVSDIDDDKYGVLVFADRYAVSVRDAGTRGPKLPPLPAPRGDWKGVEWAQLSRSPKVTDLDYLIYEVLSLASGQPDDPAHIRANGRRLRVDVLNGVPVGVFELPTALETHVPAGRARLRFWMDNSGVLRRLELRTVTGGLAQLDLDLTKRPPKLPSRVR